VSFSLKNKNVLYVAPRFFGYDKEIGDELKRRGATVDILWDRPFDTPLLKAITRIRTEWVAKFAERYYERETAMLSRKDYDLVFIINGQTLTSNTLKKWRTHYVNAKFVLYMWDSFGNRPSAINNLRFFDERFSFDPNDSAKFGMHFRPLFFSKGFEGTSAESRKYDISFVGTAHTDRYAIVSAVKKGLKGEVAAYWYLYLQAKWVYLLSKFVKRSFRTATIGEFRFDPLKKVDVQRIFFASNAILDIEHPNQTGLTMRTLEALGARKKLVTTNKNIRCYDFYSHNNICILDRQNPVIPEDFLSAPYEKMPPSTYRRYSLEGWMDEILSNVTP